MWIAGCVSMVFGEGLDEMKMSRVAEEEIRRRGVRREG